MNDKKIRYVELHYRLKTIKAAKEQLDEQMKNAAMTMLAKAFDKEIEDKQIASHALLGRWIEELETEIEEIQNEISVKSAENIYQKATQQEEK